MEYANFLCKILTPIFFCNVAVQHLQHLKRNQTSLLAELERMMAENEQLRKFQESVLQKQALERMYQMGM